MNAPTTLVVDDLSIDLPATVRSTVEQVEGLPEVRRFFPGGPAVYALSCEHSDASAVDAVGAAAGSLITAYRSQPNYSRTPRPAVQVPGTDEAALFEFLWDDSNGVAMHSCALVAHAAGRVVVFHGTVPVIHGADAYAAMESVVLSCRPTVAGGAP